MPRKYRTHSDIRMMRYKKQQWRSKTRGIEFMFSFDEWVEWWENNLGPDWLSKRGLRKGQYVMARKGDQGPYHPDNVECITASKNCSVTNKNAQIKGMKGKGRRKLTEEQVKEIFISHLRYEELAIKYGVERSTIGHIKRGEKWSPTTKGLKKYTHSQTKLSNEEVRAIYLSPLHIDEIAKQFNISYHAVWDIKAGRNWKKITGNLEHGGFIAPDKRFKVK